MLQNIIAGLQGIIDHAMVGHFVGYTGNAAIGVSWQIIIVVIVFCTSVFTGMAVLVARFAGANEPDKVNRVVYQAFLTAAGMAVVLGAAGWIAAPSLLDLVNAAPDVHAAALPFLRTMFVGIIGLMMFFILGGAFRAAGDPHTPLRLGIAMTVLTIVFNIVLIPAFGPVGAAYGTVASSSLVSAYGIWRVTRPESVIHFEPGMDLRPDFAVIRSLFKFGLPTGVQGIAMNVGGVLMLRFIGALEHSAESQAAYTVGYSQLFSLITWTSVGLMGAAATIAGQNLGAKNPDRAVEGVRVASHMGLGVAAVVGAMFLLVPRYLLAGFGMTDMLVIDIAETLLRYLAFSGFFITVALSYTGGLQGTGDTRSPLYISILSQVVIPIGICSVLGATTGLTAEWVWTAILIGHMTRSGLSVARFRQQKWRSIEVDLTPSKRPASSSS
jgi:putative MATE family efflux protein